MDFQEISHLIIKIGKTLAESQTPQIESRHIRELQYYLNSRIDITNSKDFIYFIFFLDLLTNDIFYNLSGDGSYHDSLIEVRKQVFSEFGNTLLRIGEAISSEKLANLDSMFSDLVFVYIQELKRLNLLMEKNVE